MEHLKQSIKTSPHRVGKKSPKSLAGDLEGQRSSMKSQNIKALSDKEDKKLKKLCPDNPLKPKPKEKKEGHIVDYLKE